MATPIAEAEIDTNALTVDVLILAPTGRDAPLAQGLLEAAGFRARVCEQMQHVCSDIDDDSGVLLIAEEALNATNRDALLDALAKQPTWSDIPIIVLTGEGELRRSIPEVLSLITLRANVTLIERPVRLATLVTTVRSALRARMRQLDLRDYLIERHESEKRLLVARQEAEEANQAKSNFLTTMSHELRTPLNAIAGYTQLLMMGIPGPVTDPQKQQLERIEKSERHLLALINDVLNFAKLEAGHVTFDINPVDVGEIVRGLITFIAPQLQSKKLGYEEEIVGELVADTDEEKVRQILLNLLSNSIKFTAAHGEIKVRAWRTRSEINVSVTDNGEGIREDKIREIFEPFVQVGRTLNSASEGTGLGLAISKDLARRLGGDLTAHSEVGVGSTFTLSLPA